jgi:hypothetical protein
MQQESLQFYKAGKYLPEQVFNADELDLFFNKLGTEYTSPRIRRHCPVSRVLKTGYLFFFKI